MKQDLRYWQQKFRTCQDDYAQQLAQMTRDWAQYKGDVKLYDEHGNRGKDCTCVRNFTFELIESQIDTSVPMPKVTAPTDDPRKQHNAKVIEAMLKDFMRRMRAEELNDNDERICKIFGSSFTLLYWADDRPQLKSLHPAQVIPQSGMRDIQDMDYVFVTYMQSIRALKRQYGVQVDASPGEQSQTPDAQAVSQNPDELIEQVVVYYKNDIGNVGMFSWAGESVLVDIENFHERSRRVCKQCGASAAQAIDGKCACGSETFVWRAQQAEELLDDTLLSDGVTLVPKTQLPYYVPQLYPVLMRKNVSLFDSFLGDGDCARIYDLQMAHNKLATKVQEKVLKGGSLLTLPKGMRIETSDRECKVVQVQNPTEMSMIAAISLQPDISQDYRMLQKYYEDAKSTLGITDSYQGKQDMTAQSGVARQAAIQQAAGRLLCKIKMKNAFYENLYRAVFQYMLAYTEGTITLHGQGEQGQPQELVFNRYNFLQQRQDGCWYYDDDYLFEIDAAASLTQDRQGMWQEIRQNYQSGAYGQPGTPEALVQFWKTMDAYDYPLAAGMVCAFEQQQTQDTDEVDSLLQNVEQFMNTQGGTVNG